LLLSLPLLCLSFFSPVDLVSSYECGFEPIGVNHLPFCMKFFLLIIIFIIFDVEVSFLVPSLFAASTLISFLLVLILGLLYEFAYGGLS